MPNTSRVKHRTRQLTKNVRKPKGKTQRAKTLRTRDVFKKNRYTQKDIMACSQGELFGQEGPRLPLPPLLMFDRIDHISRTGGKYGKGEVIGQLTLSDDTWFFDCHFKDDPVMPGSLGLEALWQILGFFLGRYMHGQGGTVRALGVGEVKFSSEIRPNARTLTYRIDVRKIHSGKINMAIGDGTIEIDGKVALKAENLKVAIFDKEQEKA